MRVCVLNEDEAWFLEKESKMPDHRFHFHWTAKKATEELRSERVRLARHRDDVVSNVVVLQNDPEVKKRAYATDWRPRMSGGCPVWQLTTEAREGR